MVQRKTEGDAESKSEPQRYRGHSGEAETQPNISGDSFLQPVVRLVVLIGVPGSGKSTLAQRMVMEKPGRSLISTDAIRSKLFGDEAVQGSWQLIWQEVRLQMQQAVQQSAAGTSPEAIYDATNTVRRHRRELISLACEVGFTQITGIWLDVPLGLCLERNAQRDRQVPVQVIQKMHDRLQVSPPTLSEGFTHLIHYSYFFSRLPTFCHPIFPTTESREIPPGIRVGTEQS